MTNIDTGTYGAKRQSYRKASPRDLLKRVMEENARANEQKLQKIFADSVRQDEDYIDAIIEYWFANNYRSLVHKPPQATQAVKAERAARVEVVKKTIKAAATRMVLLEMILPNGKPLKDCTGKDCAKAGGWLAAIAGKVKPAQKVGLVLSEEDIWGLFQARA